MFRKLLGLTAIAISIPALAQQSITITTRSAGTMYASDFAAGALGLPHGGFPYQLVQTSEIFGNPLFYPDEKHASGQGNVSLTLSFNGQTHTYQGEEVPGANASLGSNVPFGEQTEYFSHGVYFGFGRDRYRFDGGQSVYWPVGSPQGIHDFSQRDVNFDPAYRADVHFNLLSTSGDTLGTLDASATSFHVTIMNPVPEPAGYSTMAAGLAALAIAGRLKSRRTRAGISARRL